MFRKYRGVSLPYSRQGLIYFTCQNYRDADPPVREKIDALCRSAGGEYHRALFEMMTTQRSVTQLSGKYYVSPSTLYRVRKRFYEDW